MNRASFSIAMVVLAVAGTVQAQNPPPKKSASGSAVLRGKNVFAEKCAVCHNANSSERKIGPGLQGISKRGTFTVNGKKITDESLKTWIESGDTLMPPFKDVLTSDQLKDVIAYIKTL